MRVTTTYDRVRRLARRKVKCPGCGRDRMVQRTFSQTINPFHPAIRTLPEDASYEQMRAAVLNSVVAEAKAWVPSDYESRHVKCIDD